MSDSLSPFSKTILDRNPNCFFKGPREGSPLAYLPVQLAKSQLPLRKLMSDSLSPFSKTILDRNPNCFFSKDLEREALSPAFPSGLP